MRVFSCAYLHVRVLYVRVCMCVYACIYMCLFVCLYLYVRIRTCVFCILYVRDCMYVCLSARFAYACVRVLCGACLLVEQLPVAGVRSGAAGHDHEEHQPEGQAREGTPLLSCPAQAGCSRCIFTAVVCYP